jgi:hypothetical protein
MRPRFFCIHGWMYIAGGMEKVRPGTGREAGLGHAGSGAFTLLRSQVKDSRGDALKST